MLVLLMANSLSEQVLLMEAQSTCRKDIKSAFGVLNARLHCMFRASHLWNKMELINLSIYCFLLDKVMIKAGDDYYFDDSGNLASNLLSSIKRNALKQQTEIAKVVDINDFGDLGQGDVFGLEPLIESDVHLSSFETSLIKLTSTMSPDLERI